MLFFLMSSNVRSFVSGDWVCPLSVSSEKHDEMLTEIDKMKK
ncbi:hypothetical protein SDC9_124898 [bioreactor metagenome]|uniref:Uncharacterized protein n=1 Tax=bioreactor metagenome TaxID=1076179 RepID=A0A645CLX8_9ZZZZ